jgi:outer membrane protein assembly factor BamB
MGSIVSSTPAIASDGTLYVGGIGGFLVALNGSTGKSVWSVNLNGRINCSPAIGSDGKIYIGSDDKHLYSIK